MSTKLKAVEPPEGAAEEAQGARDFTEELPPIHIDPTSFEARMAGVESCSVVREISKHWSTISAFEVEQEGRIRERAGEPPLSEYEERERRRELWRRRWEPRPQKEVDELVEYIKRKAVSFVDWDDIGRLWSANPRDAIECWRAVRLEARDEFISGHYGARAFEVMRWHHEVWRRAQYLAVRDGLIEEWRPRGASEFILIDQMTQSYVMQMEWTERAMTRLQGEPRVESYEFRQWVEQRKLEAKVNHWNPGHWDVPYQEEAEAVEQAFRMVELCAKSFQRAARQLANIRLVRAKTARMRRRERAKTIKGVKVA